LIRELGNKVPNHNIWSPTSRYSILLVWSIHTVQHHATGISCIGL
jgi:hypothetical protein